jgi:hypothetical protein
LSSGSVSPNGARRNGGSVQGLSWTSTGRFSGRTGAGSFVRWTAVPDAGPLLNNSPSKRPKRPDFPAKLHGFSLPKLRRRGSRNYTPSAPKSRLIATQVSDQIGGI